jgi:uncharacterized protein (TIGR03067 family)
LKMSRVENFPALEGVWLMVRAELDGEAAPEVVVQNTSLELAAGEYRVSFRGDVMDQGTFEPADTPATLLLRGTTGPNSGRSIPCLYQVNGGRLRICFGLDGNAPNEFRTTAGGARYLATYRRKDEPTPAPCRVVSREG